MCSTYDARACGELMAILDVMNAWADAERLEQRATHAELTALLLPRLPPVIPTALPPLEPEEARTLMAVLAQMRAAGRRRVPTGNSNRRRRGEGPRAMRRRGEPRP